MKKKKKNLHTKEDMQKNRFLPIQIEQHWTLADT